MQSLSLELNKVVSDFDKLLADIPDMRRELHTELSQVLESEVDSAIAGSLNDSHGKIQGWQDVEVGSGGGYAAMRAMKGSTGANSPGAITNYLENGHKIRPRGNISGKGNSRYRPRINTSYVSGRHFYAKSQATMEAKLISHAEAYVQKLGARMEGAG